MVLDCWTNLIWAPQGFKMDTGHSPRAPMKLNIPGVTDRNGRDATRHQRLVHSPCRHSNSDSSGPAPTRLTPTAAKLEPTPEEATQRPQPRVSRLPFMSGRSAAFVRHASNLADLQESLHSTHPCLLPSVPRGSCPDYHIDFVKGTPFLVSFGRSP